MAIAYISLKVWYKIMATAQKSCWPSRAGVEIL